MRRKALFFWMAGIFTLILNLLLTPVLPALESTSESEQLDGVRPCQGSPVAAGRQNITAVKFLGSAVFKSGATFKNTRIGGLSGITYDTRRKVYYALSDDRSQIGPARYYTLRIELSDAALKAADIQFEDVTLLRNQENRTFEPGSLDPEGIALSTKGHLFISSEGDAGRHPPIPPFVNVFTLCGKLSRKLPIPDKFLPALDGKSGIRNNLGFESLTLTPNQHDLYTATENALVQDGPAADADRVSLSRVIQYDLKSERPRAEFIYVTNPVAAPPEPADAFRTSGLVELLAIDNHGSLLALERSYSSGRGNTVRLYQASTTSAFDVSEEFALFDEKKNAPFKLAPPIAKRLLVDLADFEIKPGNLEGMTFGPRLTDGRRTLIMVSDNNFSPGQVTQFIALALTLESTNEIQCSPQAECRP